MSPVLRRVLVALVAVGAPAVLVVIGSVPVGASGLGQVARLVPYAAAALVVMAVPGAGTVAAVLRRWPNAGEQLAVVVGAGIVGSVTLWWVVLWLWALWAPLGVTLGVAGYIAGLVAVVAWLPWGGPLPRRLLACLVVVLAAFLVANGVLFARGGLPVALNATQSLYGSADNYFPHDWAGRVLDGDDLAAPALGGWPPSDRPPVQAAVTLGVVALSEDRELASHVGGSLLQSLGVLGVVVVLAALGAKGRRLGVATLLVTLTAFVTISTVFVWPKLFPSALLVVAAAVFLEQTRDRRSSPPADATNVLGWAVVAGLVAISIVTHSIGLLGLPMLAVIAWRHWFALPAVRQLLPVLVVPVMVAGWWFVYRVFVDPAPSAVAQWHLAGIAGNEVQGPLLETVVDRYRQIGVGGALRQRLENLWILSGGRAVTRMVEEAGEAPAVAVARRSFQAPMLAPGLLLVALPLLWWWRRLGRGAASLLVGAALSMGLWVLVWFGPPVGAAVTSHGPYAAFLAVGVVLALAVVRLLPRWCGWVLLAAQGALWLWLMLGLAGTRLCLERTTCAPLPIPEGSIGPGVFVAPVFALALVGVALLYGAVGLVGGGRVDDGDRRASSCATIAS